MILRHWPTYPTPLSLTCFFISENSWTKIGIRRFLCSRFRPTNLWNVFLSVRVHSFIKLMGECQKSSHWALNISLQSVQLLTTELLGKKKNPFRFLAGLQLVQTVNIPGRTEWHHGWNWHPKEYTKDTILQRFRATLKDSWKKDLNKIPERCNQLVEP